MTAVIHLHACRPDNRMARMAANARGILNEPHRHQPQTVIEAGQFYLTDVQEWERQQTQRKIAAAQERQASETWPPAVKRRRWAIIAEAAGVIVSASFAIGMMAYVLMGV